MSNINKTLIGISIVAFIAVSGVFIYSQNSKLGINRVVTQNQSSSVRDVTSTLSSMNNSSVISTSTQSLLTSISTNESSQKVEDILVGKDSKCDLPESENLVRAEEGCFNYVISFNTFSNDVSETYKPIKTPQLDSVIIEVMKDFYNINKSKILTNEKSIYVEGSQKIDNNTYNLYLSIIDPDYLKTNGYNMNSGIKRFGGNYKILKNNTSWSFEIISNKAI